MKELTKKLRAEYQTLNGDEQNELRDAYYKLADALHHFTGLMSEYEYDRPGLDAEIEKTLEGAEALIETMRPMGTFL